MLVNGVLFGIVAGYLAHQIAQFGAGWKPEQEKATLDNRLKSLIPNHWLEGQAESLVNGIVDALAVVLTDEGDVKQLLIDLESKDWVGTVAVVAKLISTSFKPTSDEGKAVLLVANEAIKYVEGWLDDEPVQVAVVGPEVTAEPAHASPLVEAEHVAPKATA